MYRWLGHQKQESPHNSYRVKGYRRLYLTTEPTAQREPLKMTVEPLSFRAKSEERTPLNDTAQLMLSTHSKCWQSRKPIQGI